MNIPYTITHDTVTLVLDGQTHTIRRGARNFDEVRTALLHEQWDALPEIVSVGRKIERWLGPGWTYVDHHLEYDGRKVNDKLNERLLAMMEEGADPRGWQRFWERLQRNPSWRSVNQLYAFLAHQNIPIDEEDGHILAYKSVRPNYRDHYTDTVDNSPGTTNEMPRNQISDDPNVACHEGFHVGALKYALGFRSDKRVVICKVDPADVVSVPHDSSAMKVRVCRYTVIGNYSGDPLPSTHVNLNEDDEYEDDDHEYLEHLQDELEEFARDDEHHSNDDLLAFDVETQWKRMDVMTLEELEKLRLPELRSYAANHLKIVRASKIPGGKAKLLERIIQVRGG